MTRQEAEQILIHYDDLVWQQDNHITCGMLSDALNLATDALNPWHKVADGDLPEDGQHILYAQKTPYGLYYGVIYYPEPFITDDMDYWMDIPEILKED